MGIGTVLYVVAGVLFAITAVIPEPSGKLVPAGLAFATAGHLMGG